jgi:hypothetical protein
MKNLILLAILAGLAWFGYGKYQEALASQSTSRLAPVGTSAPERSASVSFKCDGRTHCSHMTSCAEATYFIQHCPNTEMDGDGDGVPCERQWCSR